MLIQRILTKVLGMKRVCSTWVSYFHKPEEMEWCCSVYLENLAQIFQDPDFVVSSLLTNPIFIITILKQNVSQRDENSSPVKVSRQSDVGRLLRLLRDSLSKCVPSKNTDK